MKDDFTKRVLASIDKIDVGNDIKEQVIACFDRIKSIPQDKRGLVLQNIGLVLCEAFEVCGEVLATLLLVLNQAKCTPPLPEGTVVRIARAVEKRAEQNAGRMMNGMMSGIICLTIPADDVKAVEGMIEALPYDFAFAFSDIGITSPFMQKMLAGLQAATIDDRIDTICRKAMSASDAGVSIDN